MKLQIILHKSYTKSIGKYQTVRKVTNKHLKSIEKQTKKQQKFEHLLKNAAKAFKKHWKAFNQNTEKHRQSIEKHPTSIKKLRKT